MNARSECSFVPNQALYQAEPQRELIVNPVRQRDARVRHPPRNSHSSAILSAGRCDLSQSIGCACCFRF
jgi:hypothetical protein